MVDYRRQATRSVLGSGILAALATTALLIFLLDDIVSAMRGRSEVVVLMSEARGLRRGAPVWIAGKPVGRVMRIGFMPGGADTTARLAITLEIDERFREQLRTGSRARLTSDRLIGEPVVDILPGAPTSPLLAPTDTIPGLARPGGSLVMARGKELGRAIDSLRRAARPLAASLEARSHDLERVQRGFQAVQREFTFISEDLSSSSAPRLLQDPRFHASLERFALTVREVGAVLDSVRARHATGPRQVVSAIERLRHRASVLSADLSRLRALATESSALHRLANDSAIARALHGVRAQADSLIAEARRDPLRFVF